MKQVGTGVLRPRLGEKEIGRGSSERQRVSRFSHDGQRTRLRPVSSVNRQHEQACRHLKLESRAGCLALLFSSLYLLLVSGVGGGVVVVAFPPLFRALPRPREQRAPSGQSWIYRNHTLEFGDKVPGSWVSKRLPWNQGSGDVEGRWRWVGAKEGDRSSRRGTGRGRERKVQKQEGKHSMWI